LRSHDEGFARETARAKKSIQAPWRNQRVVLVAPGREIDALVPFQDMNKALTGLIAAPHTPFQPDGSVAYDVIPRQARLLAQNGVSGAFICGTTGEGASLTSDERRRVAEAWVKTKAPSVSVIVHVGHLSVTEAQGFAKHAQEIGADANAT